MNSLFSRILAAAVLFGGTIRADDLVIDDATLSKDFAHKLGAMVDQGKSINGKKAGEMLKGVVGKKTDLPEAPQPCSLEGEGTLYGRVLPAVVAIGSVYKCGKCNDWHLGAFATGWILSSDGLIVTNHHVLEKDDANTLGVMTVDGSVYPLKEILAADKAGDAAVFRVDTLGKKLPYLRIAAGSKVGEEISIISHPKGRFYCLSEGVVSRFHTRGSAKGGKKAVWMSVTADYAVGSSGGPVLNENGEVVGMVSSTLTATTGAPRGGEKAPQGGAAVQMVFKDCVSLATLRGLFNP